jgi:hypothetical protein
VRNRFAPEDPAFVVLDRTNTATITLNDNGPGEGAGYTETVQTLYSPRAINWTVFNFAQRRKIPMSRVGYVIIAPEEGGGQCSTSSSKPSPTCFPISDVVNGL